jgi:hypothetical protein
MPDFAFAPVTPSVSPTERDLGRAVMQQEVDKRNRAMQPSDDWTKALNAYREKNMMRNVNREKET